MISKKIMTILVGVLVLLALAPLTQAATSNLAFSEDSSAGKISVQKGKSVKLELQSLGIMEKLQSQELLIKGGPNSINKQLFKDFSTGTKEPQNIYKYSRTYNLDTSKYSQGTYNIEYITKGTTSPESKDTLTLTIKPKSQDNNDPSLTIDYPNQGQTYNSQVTELRYTPTDAEGNLDKCWYSTDSGQTNSSKVNCNDGTQNTFSGLSSQDGSNTWTVYASDENGNTASESVTFTYNDSNNGGGGDQNAPNVNILFPQSTAYQSVNRADFTVNDPENNLSTCRYSLNGGNQKTVICEEVATLNTINIDPTKIQNTLTIYAEDKAGNVGQSSVDFRVEGNNDTKAPQIKPIKPKNNENIENGQLRLKVSTSEEAEVNYSISGITNGNLSMNSDSSGKVHKSSALHNFASGESYEITYYASDMAGNKNSITVSFSVEEDKEEKSNQDNEGDGFDAGQGDMDSYGGQKYLDQFNNDRKIVVNDTEDNTEQESYSDIKASWLLPLLAALIGILLILIAVLLGLRNSEEGEALDQPNNQVPQTRWY